MTRNQRKVKAKAKAQATLARLASLAVISRRNEVVAANMSHTPSRNYYAGISDSFGMISAAPRPREARRKLYVVTK